MFLFEKSIFTHFTCTMIASTTLKSETLGATFQAVESSELSKDKMV